MNTNQKQAEILKFLCLGLSYAFSFAYVDMFFQNISDFGYMVYLTVLGASAVLWLELTIAQQKKLGNFTPTLLQKVEVHFWEVILLLLCVNFYFGQSQVLTLLFIKMVVIYMVLCGTGHLLGGTSSCLMPLDLINGMFRIPFSNFFARIVSVYESITDRRAYKAAIKNPHTYNTALFASESTENAPIPTPAVAAATVSTASTPIPVPNANAGAAAGAAAAIPEKKRTPVIGVLGVLCFILLIFIAAIENLAKVDANFEYALVSIDNFLANLSLELAFIKFLLSIPVGAYLFGLFQGSVRAPIKKEQHFRENIVSHASKIRFMPDVLFGLVISVFLIVYLIFYISQAEYMFSAFAGVLPEAFTASEYAVSGFHELINVVLINFILLSLVRIFGSHENLLLKVESIILMVESMIFACISASKIILYMSRFGYTPSRTLGLWGTVVVFVGALLAIVYLAYKKKTFLPWVMFAAASYVAMNFMCYPFIIAR